jgi:hypothetical protein
MPIPWSLKVAPLCVVKFLVASGAHLTTLGLTAVGSMRRSLARSALTKGESRGVEILRISPPRLGDRLQIN